MVKIYGSSKSSARRCYWCLEEAGVSYQAVPIDFRAKEHQSESYKRINPNGKVPSLVDGDLTVWESMAINFYLGDAYKQDLIGHTTRERAPIRQWSFWALGELQPPMVESLIQLQFVPEEKRDMGKVEKALAKAHSLLQVLEQRIHDGYLVGNRFTLADLNVASVVEINQMIENDISDFPQIMAWMEQLQARPAYLRLKDLTNS